MSVLYTSQRRMRQILHKARQSGVIGVVDIGSMNVSCLILKFDPRALEVGYSENDAYLNDYSLRVIGYAFTRSRGIRRGEIDNMQDSEGAMRTVLGEAQRRANTRIEYAVVSFSGGGVRSYGIHGEVEIGGMSREAPIVREKDIAHAIAACEIPDAYQSSGADILYCQPVTFKLDERDHLHNPFGQRGRELSVDMHILQVDPNCVKNIIYCLKKCDIEAAGFGFSGHMSGLSTLTEGEKNQGCACIDLGAQTTGVSIFYKNHMIFSECHQVGGQEATSDIEDGLKIGTELAERIKTRNGGAIATGIDEREDIALFDETSAYEHERRYIQRASLINIINPRMSCIFEKVRAILKQSEFHHLPVKQIILTGGGAHMPGIEDLAQNVLGFQTSTRRPWRPSGTPEMFSGFEHSALIGLCRFATQPQDKFWDYPLAQPNSASIFNRAAKIFRAGW